MFWHLFNVFPIFICKAALIIFSPFSLSKKKHFQVSPQPWFLLILNSASLILQLLMSLYSLAPIPSSSLHNKSYQHLRGSSCVLINSRTWKKDASYSSHKTMLKKNTSGPCVWTLRDCYLIDLDTAVISGQEYTGL